MKRDNKSFKTSSFFIKLKKDNKNIIKMFEHRCWVDNKITLTTSNGNINIYGDVTLKDCNSDINDYYCSTHDVKFISNNNIHHQCKMICYVKIPKYYLGTTC